LFDIGYTIRYTVKYTIRILRVARPNSRLHVIWLSVVPWPRKLVAGCKDSCLTGFAAGSMALKNSLLEW
jgi:hypothetical protein